jgi:hypothetical protein
MLIKKTDLRETRTHNLQLRRLARYPLRQQTIDNILLFAHKRIEQKFYALKVLFP